MNVGFSRNSLPRRKDVYHSSQWKKKNSKGTHCVLLFIDRNAVVCFDFFRNWIYSARSIKQNQR